MENGKDRVNRTQLARIISDKYSGLTFQTTKDFLTIVCDEILNLVLEEKKEVFFNKLVSIKLEKKDKKGYDFKNKKHIASGEHYKLSLKPLEYLKEQVRDLNSKFESEV